MPERPSHLGNPGYTILGAEIAREMIEAGEYEDVASKWAAEHKRRWEQSKFFKLWEKGTKAGRDPRKAFKERGWEPRAPVSASALRPSASSRPSPLAGLSVARVWWPAAKRTGGTYNRGRLFCNGRQRSAQAAVAQPRQKYWLSHCLRPCP